MQRFKNRNILISAGAGGLGLAIALRFASEGGNVVVLDKSEETIAQAKDQAKGIRFEAVDLLDNEALSNTLLGLEGEGQRFDTLINNAGGSLHTPQPFLEETDEDWERVLSLNVMAAVRLTRLMLPHMLDTGFGRIVNLGSKAGR